MISAYCAYELPDHGSSDVADIEDGDIALGFKFKACYIISIHGEVSCFVGHAY